MLAVVPFSSIGEVEQVGPFGVVGLPARAIASTETDTPARAPRYRLELILHADQQGGDLAATSRPGTHRLRRGSPPVPE